MFSDVKEVRPIPLAEASEEKVNAEVTKPWVLQRVLMEGIGLVIGYQVIQQDLSSEKEKNNQVWTYSYSFQLNCMNQNRLESMPKCL